MPHTPDSGITPSRGDKKNDIYMSDLDRDSFLMLLGDVCGTHNWVCHAYCLMDNHYHLLIETPDANLSRGMRQLNGVYTQNFNRSHNQVGHVFQGRYIKSHSGSGLVICILPGYCSPMLLILVSP